MDESNTDLQLPPEAQARTLKHAMELWVEPEIERRRSLGLVDGDFALAAAQVIMREGEPIEVRLNQEVRAVGRVRVRKDVRSGDAVHLADVEDVLDRVHTVRNEDKLAYWAALLAGSATIDRPQPSDRERVVDTLDSLRPEHLRLLHVIATTTEGPPNMYMVGINSTLDWKMPDVGNDEARVALLSAEVS